MTVISQMTVTYLRSADTLQVGNSPIKHFLLKFDMTGVSFNHRIVDG
jgi:hypothetical protein